MARIRHATEDDLRAISDIYNHYVDRTVITFDIVAPDWRARRKWFEKFDRKGPHRLYVATGSGGVILGYAYSGPFRDRAAYDETVEVTVYLAPHAEEQGIGSALYTALFDALEKEKVHRAVAGIAMPNPGSVALHKKFGFKPVGTFTEVGFKFGNYIDVLFMERTFEGK